MRLRAIIVKEMLQGKRDKMLVRMSILMPLIQTLLLSYAANLDVRDVPLTVLDADRSVQSRELVNAVANAGDAITLAGYRSSPAELERDLDYGRAMLCLSIPSGFARDLAQGRAVVQVLADGSQSTTSTVAAGYLAIMIGEYGAETQRLERDRRGLRGTVGGLRAEPRVFYNPDLRTLWFMAPAILTLVLTTLMQNIMALSIARERELGTLEQVIMTPVKSWEILLGKLIPVGVIGLLDALAVGLIIVFGLGVPFRGSLLVLVTATLVFLFSVLGLGLLVSAVSQNQQQAQLTNLVLIFPSMLLSGFIFPISNLPAVLLPISYLVPMTHYLQITRGVFLRGSGFAPLWPQFLWLSLLCLLFFGLGALLFTKKPA